MHQVCTCALRGQKGASDDLELELSCHVHAELNPGPLEEYSVLLTTEPSHQPLSGLVYVFSPNLLSLLFTTVEDGWSSLAVWALTQTSAVTLRFESVFHILELEWGAAMAEHGFSFYVFD